MHYDPLGRLIKTDFPDGTTSKVVFDAWQQKNYDQNDCDKASPHYNTPQIIDLDVLDRPFQTTDDNGIDKLIVTHNQLDITGRILFVTDALNRVATENIYALGEKHLLYTKNIDSGERWMLNDTAGKPVRKWDGKGNEFQYEYDELQRKTQTVVFDESDPNNIEIKVLEKIVYGDDAAQNNIGQIAEIKAQDGKTTFEYDFKGNNTKQTKQFTVHYENETNWDEKVDLQSEEFITQTEYNALNCPVKFTHPDGTEIYYLYDKGGKLTQILHNQEEYVRKITYFAARVRCGFFVPVSLSHVAMRGHGGYYVE